MKKSFYTNVTQWGNQLLVRSIHNGLHDKQKVKFQPTLYTSSSKANIATDWKTLYDVPVYELHPGDINECKEFIKTHENIKGFDIFGQTNYALQYVAQEHPEEIIFDSELLSILTIDIETAVAETGEFPHPKFADQEILLITIRDKNTKQTTIFGSRPYTGKHSDIYVLCRDEKDLLKRFLVYWQSKTPDIITGWNCDLFDIPYIVNRIQKVLGNDEHKKLSPWNIVNERSTKVRGSEELTFDIVGVSSLDYLVLYKKYTYQTQASYKLDHIAEVELKEKKLDHTEWNTFREFYLGNWEKFTDYNHHDVLLVDMLDDKLKLIELHLTMSYKAKTNYNDALSPVKLWDAIIYNDLLHKKIVIPNKEHSSKSEKFEGAFVKDPIAGKHRWVAAFDLQSLYPHIIMGSNISPETITDVRMPVTIDGLLAKEELPEVPYAITGNGWCYSKDKHGFLPELMETMYNSRSIYKKQMLKVEQEYEKDKSNKQLLKEISRLTNLQMAVKIALNSAYGALGSAYFRYYDLRLAESITTTGQLAIKWIANSINVYMNTALKTDNVDYILMSDTDSVYLSMETLVETTQQGKTTEEKIQFMDKFCDKILTPYIERSYQDLADYLGSYQQKMIMKREVLADVGVIVAKKRYILRVHNSEGVQYKEPKIKIMGLEMIKSSTPKAIQDSLKSTIGIILDGTNTDLIAYVNGIREEFYKLSVEEIAFPRSVNDLEKWSSNTSIYIKSTPIQVRGSLLFNHFIKEYDITSKYQSIKSGEKIKFIYLKKPNTIRENVISFPNELPIELGLHKYIDYDLQFEKVFEEALENIINPIGWTLQEVNSLEAFFM
jgi:DNA polymerase elongation subunit (family B)